MIQEKKDVKKINKEEMIKNNVKNVTQEAQTSTKEIPYLPIKKLKETPKPK